MVSSYQAQSSTFVDDRTVWHTGREAPQELISTLTTAAAADRALALEIHPDKVASWATRPQHRAHLQQHQQVCGSVCDTFKLLGLRYRVGSDSGFIEGCGIQEVVARRARRICLAARSLFIQLPSLMYFYWGQYPTYAVTPRFACVRSCQHVFLDGPVGCCCPYYCAGMGTVH